MKSELGFTLQVADPGFSDVAEAVGQLLGFLRDHALGDETFLGEFELAAAEALNNAVKHGSAGDGRRFFRAHLALRAGLVELRVSDPSNYQGPATPPQLPEDPLAEGGRGSYLMAQLADEVLHESGADGHVLILRKKCPEAVSGYVPGRIEQTLVEMTDELVSSYEMINSLLSLSEWLATAPEMNTFSSGALKRLCEVTGADFAYARFESGGELVLLNQWGRAREEIPEAVRTDGLLVEAEVFRGGGEKTLTGGAVLRQGDPMAGLMVQGFVTPILFKDRRRGVLVMGRTVAAEFFDAGQLKIARMLSEYLGIVVMMAELQERRMAEERDLRDLEIAAGIQLSLMPRDFAALDRLDFSGVCNPARQAGGDYFDVIAQPDGSVICVVADVMGKGLPAALLAMMLRTTLRGLVAAGEKEPGEILARANILMSGDLIQLGMFITVACVWISPDRDTLRHASAGHPAPFLLGADGVVLVLDSAGGLPIGILAEGSYTSGESPFARGSRLLVYTDGLLEAAAPDGSHFGPGRIEDALRATARLGCRESLGLILAEITGFTANAEPSDDRTAVLVSRSA